MSSRIHPQGRTTPKIPQEIKDSGLSDCQAAKVFNITPRPPRNGPSAIDFLRRLKLASPIKISKILTDNDS